MNNIVVAGIGTGVGKTVVSAILTIALNGIYWKPIETGEKDSKEMEKWLSPSSIFPPAYSFQAPLSLHHAAYLEGISLPDTLSLPSVDRPLVIESAGGILSPLRVDLSTIDFLCQWKASWILVSKHYLGSINHTLLTIEALKKRSIPLLGIVFNGIPSPFTEEPILKNGEIPLIGHLLPEPELSFLTLQHYARLWQHSGLLSPKKN